MKKLFLPLILALLQLGAANTVSAQSYPFEEGVRVRDVVTLPEGLTGKGVLVCVLDGDDFYYNHVNFLDPKTMQTRIRTVLLRDAKGNYNPVNDPEEIRQLDKPSSVGYHSTHTAGIAAGSYDADGWQGVAPEADICLAGVLGGGNTSYNMAALKGAFAVADSLGLPMVVNMSVGKISQYDGYEEINLLTEELTDNGDRPGRIIVVATANFGNYPSFNDCTIGTEGKVRLFADKIEYGGPDLYSLDFKFEALKEKELQTRLFLYDKATRQEVATGLLDGSGQPLALDEISGFLSSSEKEASPYRYYSMEYFDEVSYASEDIILGIEIIGDVGTEIKYIQNATDVEYDDYFTTVRKVYGKPNSLANSPSVISVGRYDTHFPGRTPIGQNSSFGFNKYGDKFPDVVAPGTGIISGGSNPEKSQNATRDITMPDGSTKTFSWMTMTGTSQASPLVAGVVALMLQYDPTLSVNRVRELLHSTNDWTDDCDHAPMGPGQAGHGILNTRALFEALMGPTAIESATSESSDNIIYDLFGRRLNEVPVQGIFIRNNKKIAK